MADMEKIQKLLDEAKEQLKKQQENSQKMGADFNIFSVLDRERKEESTHCRLIYELLNPEGSHGQKDLFLREFFQIIGKPLVGKVTVEREYSFDQGRIDLLLMGDNFCYPIEVKIDAGDQYRQVERYLEFAERQGKGRRDFDATVYYLTLDGHDPSEESRGNVPSERVPNISFSCKIKEWLDQCVKAVENIPNIKIILKQYLQLIDRLEGDAPMKELVNTIFDSKDFYDSAVEIAKALPSVQAQKMQRVFSRIDAVVSQIDTADGNEPQKMKSDPQYTSYLEASKRYYTTKREDPSLVYLLKEKDGLRAELWFQVDHYNDFLWYGVVLRKGDNGAVPKTQADILEFSKVFEDSTWREAIEKVAKGKYNWWVWAKKLPQANPIKFGSNSDNYSDIFYGEQFEERIKEIEKEVKHQLEEHITKTGLCGDWKKEEGK